MVDPIDAELLESLDRAHDVHQRVHRADLVQRDLIGGHAVDPALRLAQQLGTP